MPELTVRGSRWPTLAAVLIVRLQGSPIVLLLLFLFLLVFLVLLPILFPIILTICTLFLFAVVYVVGANIGSVVPDVGDVRLTVVASVRIVTVLALIPACVRLVAISVMEVVPLAVVRGC
eukprot:7211601-Pyramimonas_sp.AAC.1